jgi:hypothetical protein
MALDELFISSVSSNEVSCLVARSGVLVSIASISEIDKQEMCFADSVTVG